MVRYKKASDVFRNIPELFAKKTLLEDGFPEIEDLDMEVELAGYKELGVSPTLW